MKKPTIAITGASGFVGGVLTTYFLDKGWKVVALARTIPAKGEARKNLEYRSYDIQKPINAGTLKDVDYIVHAAYIKFNKKTPDAYAINVNGAKNIVAAAEKAHVKQLVFLSTMSAHENAISVYGKQKLETESVFLSKKNTTVLRCGLIIGDGGIVREMADFMKSKHAVPLIDGGKQPLQIVSVYDLAKVIDNALEYAVSGRLVIATPQVYSYREFYKTLARHLGVKVLYIPVPYGLLQFTLRTLAKLNISLGIEEDNLKGLKKLQSMPSQDDLKKVRADLMDLDAALTLSNLNNA